MTDCFPADPHAALSPSRWGTCCETRFLTASPRDSEPFGGAQEPDSEARSPLVGSGSCGSPSVRQAPTICREVNECRGRKDRVKCSSTLYYEQMCNSWPLQAAACRVRSAGCALCIRRRTKSRTHPGGCAHRIYPPEPSKSPAKQARRESRWGRE